MIVHLETASRVPVGDLEVGYQDDSPFAILVSGASAENRSRVFIRDGNGNSLQTYIEVRVVRAPKDDLWERDSMEAVSG